MSPSDLAFWGMLGCLALGYALGRASRQQAIDGLVRSIFEAKRLLAQASAIMSQQRSESDAAAVERLIRETKP